MEKIKKKTDYADYNSRRLSLAQASYLIKGFHIPKEFSTESRNEDILAYKDLAHPTAVRTLMAVFEQSVIDTIHQISRALLDRWFEDKSKNKKFVYANSAIAINKNKMTFNKDHYSFISNDLMSVCFNVLDHSIKFDIVDGDYKINTDYVHKKVIEVMNVRGYDRDAIALLAKEMHICPGSYFLFPGESKFYSYKKEKRGKIKLLTNAFVKLFQSPGNAKAKTRDITKDTLKLIRRDCKMEPNEEFNTGTIANAASKARGIIKKEAEAQKKEKDATATKKPK
jgi:hypothetical protein